MGIHLGFVFISINTMKLEKETAFGRGAEGGVRNINQPKHSIKHGLYTEDHAAMQLCITSRIYSRVRVFHYQKASLHSHNEDL